MSENSKNVERTAGKSNGGSKGHFKSSAKHHFLCVGIGASAGGVKALQDFFEIMPANSGMAFVVILHLAPAHESNLAAILQSKTTMPVVQVNETHKVEPDHVYVISPNQHLEMTDGVVRSVEPENNRGSRAAIDVFFRTLAAAYENNGICIVMSGTGSDGTLGLKRIKEANGFAIVQAPDDAEYDQMPRSAIETGIVDWILPVAKMPEKLIALRDSSYRLHLITDEPEKTAEEINAEESLREILTLLRVRTGHDFSNYKRPTLIRRIARHLQIHDLADLPAYLAFLRENPGEIQMLLRNLLINVTNFFRDKEAFERIEKEVIPGLFSSKGASDVVRVWSAGCASGEEAFSLAIVLTEYAAGLSDPPKFQIFATDVDEEAIAEAREHSYPETIAADVSDARLKRFFVHENGRYRVRKSVRETVLFAPHNILRDPPFSRLDLVVCRNLLIYLNRDTQERVMEIFHFALNPDGFLFLGSSESAESSLGLFMPTDKKHRIFSRKSVPALGRHLPALPIAGKWQANFTDKKNKEREQSFSLSETHFRLLEKFAPPAVLVDDSFKILYMSESAGRYLRFAGGEPTQNLLKLVHPDLLPDLRTALFNAGRDGRITETPNIHVVTDGDERSLSLYVRPVAEPDEPSNLFLVVFEENGDSTAGSASKSAKRLGETVVDVIKTGDVNETVVNRLEDDLVRVKSQLRSTIEHHEVTIEELKASNEELQAINEELRSASEELETSKEELQSVNEELITVNHELKEKVDETTRANADLQNLMASTDIATIFLDASLNIKRYTPPAQALFNITPFDIGRPLEHFTHKLSYDEIAADAAEVLRTLKPIERETSDNSNHYYIAQFLPYRMSDNRIEGVVLNFFDITHRKQYENEMREGRERLQVAMDAGKIFSWEIDRETRKLDLSSNAEKVVGFQLKESVDALLELVHTDDREAARTALNNALETGNEYEAEYRLTDPANGETVWFYSRGAERHDGSAGRRRFVGITQNISERKRAIEGQHESEERYRQLVESSTDFAIFTMNVNGRVTSWNSGAENVFGWSADSIIGQDASVLFTPEDRAKGAPQAEMKTALATGRAEDERWHVRNDGTRFYASGVMTSLGHGKKGLVKICRDATEKVHAADLNLEKQTLRRLIAAQEFDRGRIARDIHDHFGQQVTALRLILEDVKKLEIDPKINERISEAQSVAESLDTDVDFIAWELRPAALDDLGLRVALRNFVLEWAHQTKIKADFHGGQLGKARLGIETETNLYRIAQEALNNVYKHAQAKNVSVLLEKRKDNIVLIIEDDGAGFDMNRPSNSPRGMGLDGMNERAVILGGTLEVESDPQKGTTIFAKVPA